MSVRPIDPDEFATTTGETSGGQEQKELLEIEALDGTFHREEGICVRYGLKQAIATPGPVDGHDANVMAPTERHAIQHLFLFSHCRSQLSDRSEKHHRGGRRAQLCAQKSSVSFLQPLVG
jgi:hypothetical protein